jgi:hypothetical protein
MGLLPKQQGEHVRALTEVSPHGMTRDTRVTTANFRVFLH